MGNCGYICCLPSFRPYSSLQKAEEDNKILPEFGMQGETFSCKILRVIDGDTAVVIFERRGEQVRYRLRMDGINAPEMKPRLTIPKVERDEIIKRAKEATKALRDRVESRIVQLKCVKMDCFGRILGILWTKDDSVSVNDWMLKKGYAVEFHGEKKKKPKKTKKDEVKE